MSWIREERPRFAWLTNDGELILFDELHSEVRHMLLQQGVELDPWPLTCAMRAIHEVMEVLLSCGDGQPAAVRSLPTPDELCDLVRQELCRRRTLLSASVIREVLGAYLAGLRRLDIAKIHYY